MYVVCVVCHNEERHVLSSLYVRIIIFIWKICASVLDKFDIRVLYYFWRCEYLKINFSTACMFPIYGSYVQATIVLFSISVLSDYLGSLTSLYAVISGDHTVIQCCQSKRHHGFSYMAVNGCFASYSFPFSHLFFYRLTTIYCLVGNTGLRVWVSERTR